MSPTSSSSSTIYDHLVINFHQQPKMIMRNNANSLNTIHENSNELSSLKSKLNCNNLLMTKKIQSIPFENGERSKRRYTITHVTIPETNTCCSVSNQVYDKAIIQKPLKVSNISSTWKEINPKLNENINSNCLHSTLSKSIEKKQIDFRPLIINGRRRFNTISSTSPMIIVKKKSSCPIRHTSIEQVCVKIV